MNDLMEIYRKEFYQEAREILDATNADILHLEENPDNKQLLDSLFRGIHTIKGSAGSFNLDSLSEFTHHLEGLLNALRDARIPLDSEMVDTILEGTDRIGLMIDAFEKGEKAEGDPELVERFRRFYEAPLPDAGDKETPVAEVGRETQDKKTSLPVITDPEVPSSIRIALENAAANGFFVFRVTLFYTSELLENGYDPKILLKNIKEEASVYHPVLHKTQVPALTEFEPLALYLRPVLYVATRLEPEEMEDLAFDPSLMEITDLCIPREKANENDKAMYLDPNAINEFIQGAEEWLESGEQAVLEYEKSGAREAINEAFRVVHNIKGDADFLGLADLTLFSHTFETLLDNLRSGKVSRSKSVEDVILVSFDYLKKSVAHLAAHGHTPPLPPVFNTLATAQTGELPLWVKAGSGSDKIPELSGDMRAVYMDQIHQYRKIFELCLSDRPIAKDRHSLVHRALLSLEKSAKTVDHDTLHCLVLQGLTCFNGIDEKPDAAYEAVRQIITYIEGLDKEPKRIGEILVDEGKISPIDLDTILEKQKPLGKMLVEAGKVTEEDVDNALKKQELMETASQMRPEAQKEPALQTIRIDEGKVEQFTNMVGEMLIARNTYSYLLDSMETGKSDVKNTMKSLKENLHLFSRLTNEIQHEVMSLRMVPIRGIFMKFKRVVRDISRRQKKMIQLMTDGEDLEIDKKVSDMLSDPMVHLVRNACDHGIESPLERKKAGKPETGTLLLRATREGSNLCIRVIDDGRGINREKLLKKARDKGLDIRSEDDPALLDLVFMPGLSTTAQVTDISGRGVGMDVVKTTVEKLGGTVQLTSDEGKGTEIKLNLPTTLGIETVLFIESNQRSYAIPIDHIVETVKLESRHFHQAKNQYIFHYRGEVLAAFSLAELLGYGKGRRLSSGSVNGKEISTVVVNSSMGKYGLIVDRFDKNMEIAIKPPPEVFAKLELISGVSILGDGRVLLVLNPEKLNTAA